MKWKPSHTGFDEATGIEVASVYQLGSGAWCAKVHPDPLKDFCRALGPIDTQEEAQAWCEEQLQKQAA